MLRRILQAGIPHVVSSALYHMIFLNWNLEWAGLGMTRGQLDLHDRAKTLVSAKKKIFSALHFALLD
jgi:hypothetical protein